MSNYNPDFKYIKQHVCVLVCESHFCLSPHACYSINSHIPGQSNHPVFLGRILCFSTHCICTVTQDVNSLHTIVTWHDTEIWKNIWPKVFNPRIWWTFRLEVCPQCCVISGDPDMETLSTSWVTGYAQWVWYSANQMQTKLNTCVNGPTLCTPKSKIKIAILWRKKFI